MHAITQDAVPPSAQVDDIASEGPRSHYASLEIRVSRLETAMEYIREDIRNLRLELRDTRNELRAEIRELRLDFRLMFGMMVTFALGLSGMMAKGFHWI